MNFVFFLFISFSNVSIFDGATFYLVFVVLLVSFIFVSFFVCQLYKVVERPVFGRTQVGLSPTPTLPEYMTMFGLSLLNQLVLANPPPNYLPDILFRIHIYLASYLFSSSCCYYYYKTHSDRSNQTT